MPDLDQVVPLPLEAVVDANGEVVGLRITIGVVIFLVLPLNQAQFIVTFQNVEIDLDDGSVLSAKIIWQEDNTTGSYFVSGFEQLTTLNGQNTSSSTTNKSW